MNGRESKSDNDIFFLCSLIDYIARRTKNRRVDVVDALGKAQLEKIYSLADVYHSDNIDRVADDFIESAHIPTGDFDNVAKARYSIPSHWDIGKVYKRLVRSILQMEGGSVAEAVQKAYHSFISAKIDDYNSSVYYDNPQNIFLAYQTGTLIDAVNEEGVSAAQLK